MKNLTDKIIANGINGSCNLTAAAGKIYSTGYFRTDGTWTFIGRDITRADIYRACRKYVRNHLIWDDTREGMVFVCPITNRRRPMDDRGRYFIF